MDHAPHGSIFAIYFTKEEELDREVKLKRSDLATVKAIGVIAFIQDKKTHSTLSLAYEPYTV